MRARCPLDPRLPSRGTAGRSAREGERGERRGGRRACPSARIRLLRAAVHGLGPIAQSDAPVRRRAALARLHRLARPRARPAGGRFRVPRRPGWPQPLARSMASSCARITSGWVETRGNVLAVPPESRHRGNSRGAFDSGGRARRGWAGPRRARRGGQRRRAALHKAASSRAGASVVEVSVADRYGRARGTSRMCGELSHGLVSPLCSSSVSRQ
ncbi:hypothetical protein B0H10DRAFT_705343 [Mycena sp. CBHHK59/15]|nr:hypothetical protein B0H10DRAFT_705343 [Mycena sp. CBHHK59/15]